MVPDVRARACAPALAAPALVAALFAVPASAQAAGPGVDSARCKTGANWSCQVGNKLTIRGAEMEKVTAVAFMGGRGGRDDRFATPVKRSPARAVLVVPAGALTGPLRVRTSTAVVRTARSVRLGAPQATASQPVVESTTCADRKAWRCEPGKRLTIRGQGLQDVSAVAFIGRPGGRDDSFARPVRTTARRVVVTVPAEARSGRLRIRTKTAVTRTTRSVAIPQPATPTLSQVAARRAEPRMTFPIDGPHDMGQTETNNFGGGRNHQGQDLFASCGTPLVALTSAVVQQKAYHSAAGHYLVLKDARGASYAYMHLRSASTVNSGDAVKVGQRIGYVGKTGRATGCHLHFEQWTAPGWYTGGRAIDPLPLLRRLEGDHSHD